MNGQATGETKAKLISRLITADSTEAWLSGLNDEIRDGNDGAELSPRISSLSPESHAPVGSAVINRLIELANGNDSDTRKDVVHVKQREIMHCLRREKL